jgi:hypothetical protein
MIPFLNIYFRNWILTGEGIEAFPNNPLNPTKQERFS